MSHIHLPRRRARGANQAVPVRGAARRIPGVLVAAIVAGSIVAIAGCASEPEPTAYVSPAIASIPGARPAIAVFGASGRAHKKKGREKSDRSDRGRDDRGDTPCCSSDGRTVDGRTPYGHAGCDRNNGC